MAEFSPKTCSPAAGPTPAPGICGLENCHGLDIKCGSTPRNVCTEMYGLGDKCLKYAKCGIYPMQGMCPKMHR
jgi:hypothetical protein